MLGVGLTATACASSSTTSTSIPAVHAKASAKPAASFLSQLRPGTQIASTVPAQGDVNPYGVAVVPASEGRLAAGATLVSNFNDKANVQGTGTTIVQVSPAGKTTLFADVARLRAGMSCPGGVGLTTALGILPGGWVVAGSLPTTTGGALTGLDPAGCLIVLNDQGTVVQTITDKDIVGPWDMAVSSTGSSAQVFIANALGGNTSTHDGTPVTGNCTVARLDFALRGDSPPVLTSATTIGSGYPWKANKAALVLAPTGLALGRNGTLYVADTQTNAITAIPRAATRTTPEPVTADLLSAGGALNAVEITPAGRQVATRTLVKNGAGDLFGIITTPQGMLAVNDGTNALDLFRR